MVGDARHRSMDMIDQVCLALEPLGDTLAVVVNVQDVTREDGRRRNNAVAQLSVAGREEGDAAGEAAGGCGGAGGAGAV